MKKIITLFSAITFSLCSYAQWDTLHTNSTDNFHAIAFIAADSGMVVGENFTSNKKGEALKTTDGGLTWTTTAVCNAVFNSICYSAPHNIWIVGDSGYVYHSIDDGNLWFVTNNLTDKNLLVVSFLNVNLGFAAGEDGVLFRTTDGGLNWDTLNSGTQIDIHDVWFTDAMNGWVAGDGGYLAATANGGTAWIIATQYYFGFMHVQGFAYTENNLTAVAVGKYGDALISTNAGFSWDTLHTGVLTKLNKVKFANDRGGVIVGDSAVILRTEDGGSSWIRDVVSGVSQCLNGICWATDTIAYICGDNGRIIKSNTDISSVHALSVNPMSASAFPNPCSNELNIVVNLENNSSVQIEITDVSGRIVLREDEGENFAGENIFHVQGISSLSNGMYFVRVITENNSAVLPIIRQ